MDDFQTSTNSELQGSISKMWNIQILAEGNLDLNPLFEDMQRGKRKPHFCFQAHCPHLTE